MRTRTSVSTALRQAHELIEHAERNNQAPDRVWLAQLGRAYASSVRADLSDSFRYYSTHVDIYTSDCDRLERAIGKFEQRLSEAEVELASRDTQMPESVEPAQEDPPENDAVSDSFTPDQHRSFLERCMNRLRPSE